MANEIYLYPGRLKKFNLQWRQGGPSGPVLDTTGASFTVLRSTLQSDPVIAPVDETQGQYTLSFGPATTSGMSPRASFSLVIALTLPGSNEGYSPDPITIRGFIL